MSPLLLIAAILVSAVTLLAASASAAPDRSPLFSFCHGSVTEIPHIRPCPDGSLRVVR